MNVAPSDSRIQYKGASGPLLQRPEHAQQHPAHGQHHQQRDHDDRQQDGQTQ